MEDNMKICKECKHYSPRREPLSSGYYTEVFLCKRNSNKQRDIISGEYKTEPNYCHIERRSGNCGKEGKYFEAKKTTPSLFKEFIDFIKGDWA